MNLLMNFLPTKGIQFTVKYTSKKVSYDGSEGQPGICSSRSRDSQREKQLHMILYDMPCIRREFQI